MDGRGHRNRRCTKSSDGVEKALQCYINETKGCEVEVKDRKAVEGFRKRAIRRYECKTHDRIYP